MEINIKEIIESIANCPSLKELQDLKVEHLGKKSAVSLAMSEMGKIEPSKRAEYGASINNIRKGITLAIENKQAELEEKEVSARMKEETVDITLKGYDYSTGNKSILNKVVDEISQIFVEMGYECKEGPEVEDDHFNFELMNLPKDHPARDMQDSFYITENTLLRTHTSPVQARTMIEKQGQGPIKMFCPGKVYRRDDDDATHSHQFTQIECLVIDKNITMSDLKGTLTKLAKRMFGEKREIRFRSSFFPFTEPSVEVDVSCFNCDGKGCNICKGTGWIEILGAGMVHPNVLRMSGFDPEVYQGFAFGVGIERIAMLRYGITDIRTLYTNDIRVLKEFTKEA